MEINAITLEDSEYEAKTENQDKNIKSWEYCDCMKFVAEKNRSKKYEYKLLYMIGQKKWCYNFLLIIFDFWTILSPGNGKNGYEKACGDTSSIEVSFDVTEIAVNSTDNATKSQYESIPDLKDLRSVKRKSNYDYVIRTIYIQDA